MKTRRKNAELSVTVSMAQVGSLSDQTETLSEIFKMIEAFRAFDSDNDGSITADELGGILSSLGQTVSQQDVKAMMQQGDTDRDGLLDIEEFLEMTTNKLEPGDLVTYLKTVLESLDTDGDEAVTSEEFYEALGDNCIGFPVSLEDCQALVAAMDGNGDGAVSIEDLKLIVDSLL